MGKPSLFHLFRLSLEAQLRLGKPKHLAKKQAIEEAHASGRTGFGVEPPGIYSCGKRGTLQNYFEVAHHFAEWCKAHGIRSWEGAREAADKYLQERINHGLSPYTLQRIAVPFERYSMTACFAVMWNYQCDIKRTLNCPDTLWRWIRNFQ